jgi:hypothetical protein
VAGPDPLVVARKLHSISGVLGEMARGIERNGDLGDLDGAVIGDCISDLEEIRDTE